MLEATIEARRGDELPGELEGYLREQLGIHAGAYRVRQFPGGYSNLTYLVCFGDQKLVLRRPPRGTKAKSAHDMGREFLILSHLHPTFAAAPKPLHFCDDSSLLGTPFYVMSHCTGLIHRDRLAAPLPPELLREQLRQAIAVHVQLHQLNYEALGLGALGQVAGYATRQIEGWSKRFRAARTADAPDFEAIMKWLAEHVPAQQGAALIHNDFKLDNIVFDADDLTRIVGVLDWEMATLGDPLMDLGNSLAYWVEASDPPSMQAMRSLPSLTPGFPSRREQRQWYEELSGTAVVHWDFYYTAGLFRLAVIAQQIYGRYLQGQSADERFARLIHGVRALERACEDAIAKRIS